MILMFIFFALATYFIYKALSAIGKKKENHYIKIHQQKMNDDQKYSEYLEFCKRNGEIPMEKSGFRELRNKEKDLERKINDSLK